MDDDIYEYDDMYEEEETSGVYSSFTANHNCLALCGEWNIQAKVLNEADVLLQQRTLAEELKRLACVSTNVAMVLLFKCRWKPQVAAERFFQHREKWLRELSLDTCCSTPDDAVLITNDKNVTCDICLMEYDAGEAHALSSCRHFFCRECWQGIVKSRIDESLITLRCPSNTCMELVGREAMEQLFSSPAEKNVVSQIQRSFLNNFIDLSSHFRWCPNQKGCNYIWQVEDLPLEGQQVECSICNTAACFYCGSSPHRPATCKELQSWNSSVSSEGADIAFILTATKACPKCRSNIQKNGGCNHVKCKCNYEFCWKCMESWDSHGTQYFSCPFKAAFRMGNGVEEAERFMFHYKNVLLNEDSLRLETAAAERLCASPSLVKDTFGGNGSVIPQQNSSLDEIKQTISSLIQALKSARELIAYSYMKLFFESHETQPIQLFRHRLGSLERDTEALSRLLSQVSAREPLDFTATQQLISAVSGWTKLLREEVVS